MKNSNLTPAQKSQLTREAKAQLSHIIDLCNECKTQCPQPDGSQYLHGERITLLRLNVEIIEYNRILTERGQQHLYIDILYALPKYKK